MATSIWEVATEGTSAFDMVSYRPDIELSYEDRAAIDVATESDTGFVDYIDECNMSLLDSQNRVFAQESVTAIQVAKGMDMYTAMEGLKSTIRNAWEAIKEFLQKVWETIKEYVKKAKDWLARRASLGKAMLTKYSSVLRNKKVSANLEFDWCEVDITNFVKYRETMLANVYICSNKGELTDLQKLLEKCQQDADDLRNGVRLRKTFYKGMKNKSLSGIERRYYYDKLVNHNPKDFQDEIDKATHSGQFHGNLNGHVDLSPEKLGELFKEYSKKIAPQYNELLKAIKIYKYTFTTQELSETMNFKLYGDKTGPQHEKKKWSDVKDEVMQWADMDTTRYFNEALGIFEKDANSFNKIIKEFEKTNLDMIDEQYKGATGKLKELESAARSAVRRFVSSSTKVHKMYVTRLKEAISLMQTQAIAAARKAILDKGTTNESYVFNDVDMIY